MKICRSIQLCIILFFAGFLLFYGPARPSKQEQSFVINKSAAGIFLGQPRYYEHNSRVYFRFYSSPYRRGYYYYGRPYYHNYPYRYYPYRAEVYLTVMEDASAGERVESVFIDNYRVNLAPPSPRGNRGTYTYRLRPGDHYIEWTVRKSHDRPQTYTRRFYVDGYRRSANLVIDGDEFYRN